MFRANATREELLASPSAKLRSLIAEAEDYFRERRWAFSNLRVAVTRPAARQAAVSWRMDRVPEVPTLHGADDAARLTLGVFASLNYPTPTEVYAGAEGWNRQPVALLRLKRVRCEKFRQKLVRWDALAWDVGELLLGLRNRVIRRGEIDAVLLALSRRRWGQSPLVPWVRLGRLLTSARSKSRITSWQLLGDFQAALWYQAPTRLMHQCSELARRLPVSRDWVTSPDLLAGRLGGGENESKGGGERERDDDQEREGGGEPWRP